MRGRSTLASLGTLALLAAGCTRRYQPAEYVIATERISDLALTSPVRIVGERPAMAQEVVFSRMGQSWTASYGDVTAVLVGQLTKEIAKRGGIVSDNAPKSIRVTVLNIHAHDTLVAIEGSMLLRLQLGDASPIQLSIVNRSPANLYRALNGTIARAVIQILSNPDVRAYLGNMPVPAGAQNAPPADTIGPLP